MTQGPRGRLTLGSAANLTQASKAAAPGQQGPRGNCLEEEISESKTGVRNQLGPVQQVSGQPGHRIHCLKNVHTPGLGADVS